MPKQTDGRLDECTALHPHEHSRLTGAVDLASPTLRAFIPQFQLMAPVYSAALRRPCRLRFSCSVEVALSVCACGSTFCGVI